MTFFNTDLAKSPVNWVIIGLMITLFLFLAAQMVTLFGQTQTALNTAVQRVA